MKPGAGRWLPTANAGALESVVAPRSHHPWLQDLVAAGAGAILVLAFAPFHLAFLAFLCPLALFLLWTNVSPGRAAWRGFLFGITEFLVGVYWIYNAVVQTGAVWLAVLLLVLLSAACAAFPALLGYGFVRLRRWPEGFRWLVGLPAGWTILEWVRSWILTGFPWLGLGYSQIGWPLAGWAPVFGEFGITFAVVLTVATLGWWLSARPLPGRGLAMIVLVLVVWIAGWGFEQIAWTEPVGSPLRTTLIQGGITTSLKWNPKDLVPTLRRYIELTQAHYRSRLVIWPEAAVPTYLQEVEPVISKLWQQAQSHHTALIFGAPIINEQTGDAYNAVIALGKRRSDYKKVHLVPYGEYFPVPGWVKHWLKAHRLPYSSFTPGPADQPPLPVAGYRVGVDICYEIAFGREIIRQLPQAAFLVNVSDDGWFGHSLELPQQFQMARMRAAETGRYVLADTNNGVTGFINTLGGVVKRLPTGTVGTLTGDVVPYGGATPYVRWGNWFIISLSAGLLALGGLAGIVFGGLGELRGRRSNLPRF